jgi:hypothetical protein
MYAPLSIRRHRNCGGLIVAVLFAFALLSVSSSAFAQSNTPPAYTKVSGPKQAGAWEVIGRSQGCSAKRSLPRAAGNGAPLHFLVARLRRGGYRIALVAEQWKLQPQRTFPVELVAHPTFRSDAIAIAVSPTTVVIELGANREILEKFASLPMLEVKAAQTSFKLPMEGFGGALEEIDSCFAPPSANPFATPDSKPAAALPSSSTSLPAATMLPQRGTSARAASVTRGHSVNNSSRTQTNVPKNVLNAHPADQCV